MWKNAVIALPEIKILNDNIEQHNMCSCLWHIHMNVNVVGLFQWHSEVLFFSKGRRGLEWVEEDKIECCGRGIGSSSVQSDWPRNSNGMKATFTNISSFTIHMYENMKTVLNNDLIYIFLLPLFSIHSYPWIYTSQFSDFPTVLNELTQFKAGTRIQAHTLIKILTLQPKY